MNLNENEKTDLVGSLFKVILKLENLCRLCYSGTLAQLLLRKNVTTALWRTATRHRADGLSHNLLGSHLEDIQQLPWKRKHTHSHTRTHKHIRACATYHCFLLHSCTKCRQFLTVSWWLSGYMDTNAHALKHTNLLRAFVCVCVFSNFAWWNHPRAIGGPASHKHKRSSGGNWCWVYLYIVHDTCLCVCSEFSIFWPCWKEKKKPMGTSLWQQAICHHHNECTSRGAQAHKHVTPKLRNET